MRSTETDRRTHRGARSHSCLPADHSTPFIEPISRMHVRQSVICLVGECTFIYSGTFVNRLIKHNLCDYHRIIVTVVRRGLATLHFGDKSRANRPSICTVRSFKRTTNTGLDGFSTLNVGHTNKYVHITHDMYCTKEN